MTPATSLTIYGLKGNQNPMDGPEISTGKSLTVHDITELAQLVQVMMDILYKLYTTDTKPKKPTRLTEYDSCIKTFRAFCECAIAGLQDYYNLTQDWLALIDATLNKEPSSEVRRFAESLKMSIGGDRGVLDGIKALRRRHEDFFASIEVLLNLRGETGSKHFQNIPLDPNVTPAAQQIPKLKSGCQGIFDRQDGFWKARDTELSEVLSHPHRLPSVDDIMASRDFWSKYSHIVSAAIDSIRQSEDAIDVAPSTTQRRKPTAPRAIRSHVVRIGERLKLGVTHKGDEDPSHLSQAAPFEGLLLTQGPQSDNEQSEDSVGSTGSILIIDGEHSPLVEEPESSSGNSSEVTIVEPSDNQGLPASESPKIEGENNKKKVFQRFANKTTDGFRNYKRKFTNTFTLDGSGATGNVKGGPGKEFIRRLFSGNMLVGNKERKKEPTAAPEEVKSVDYNKLSPPPGGSRVPSPSRQYQGDLQASLGTAAIATPSILSESQQDQTMGAKGPLQTSNTDLHPRPTGRSADGTSRSDAMDATRQPKPKATGENKSQGLSKLLHKFPGKNSPKDASEDIVALPASTPPSQGISTRPTKEPSAHKVAKGHRSGVNDIQSSEN